MHCVLVLNIGSLEIRPRAQMTRRIMPTYVQEVSEILGLQTCKGGGGEAKSLFSLFVDSCIFFSGSHITQSVAEGNNAI